VEYPQLRIATYNLKNLFLDGEGPEKPNKEVRPLARMIDQVAADVLVVQEAGSATSLQRLNDRLARPYRHVEVLPGNSNRSIHLGVMSRLPVMLASHKDTVLRSVEGSMLDHFVDLSAAQASKATPLGFCRDLLRVGLRTETGAEVALFCVHLKSRTNQPWQKRSADEIRTAECRALHDVVLEHTRKHPEHIVCLLGDFNDRMVNDALAPVVALGFADPLGSRLKSTGRNPSTYWPRRRMRIDHILVSANGLPVVVDDSPQIHASHMARTASDHYPVSIDLALDHHR
jgi:endonuclease/exonuclease/phosphatase family metal-dependent hydrolase